MQPLSKTPVQTNSFEVGADDIFPQIDFHNLGIGDDGKAIDFPDLDYYRFDHGDKTAKLATVILSVQGPRANTPQNMRAVWLAGYFHDIGRSQPWNADDPHHARRSADILERVLKTLPDVRGDDLLCSTACKLVAHHSSRPETRDPLAMALWDADCFEAARFMPGTREGLVRLKERTALSNLCTDWAKSRDRLKTYMGFRGW